jgi:acetylornithine deacetylase
VLPRLRAVSGDTNIETRLGVNVPGLAPAADEPAQRLALRLTERNDTIAVAYGTEAGLFQRAGIPTVVCGPGDIAVAHRPDEYIERDQLAACTRFLRRLIDTSR